MKDGDLRYLFRNKFRSWQWTSIETAGTASGVPDNEFCTPEGAQGWIEYKLTHAFSVNIRPLQVAWLMQRCRYFGSAWIAVRRIPSAAKYSGVDELWLMEGSQADALFHGGLKNIEGTKWGGGPDNWNWEEIRSKLLGLAS